MFMTWDRMGRRESPGLICGASVGLASLLLNRDLNASLVGIAKLTTCQSAVRRQAGRAWLFLCLFRSTNGPVDSSAAVGLAPVVDERDRRIRPAVGQC